VHHRHRRSLEKGHASEVSTRRHCLSIGLGTMLRFFSPKNGVFDSKHS
jgi:hypothetical protein